MKKYAFHIQKGGVGKTSLSGNVAYSLSENYRVCLIDADPQGNVSSWFLKEAPEYELADVLKNYSLIDKSFVEVKNNLFILPTFGIDGTLKTFSESHLADNPFTFDKLNKNIEKFNFDVVIYDLSPGMSRLEKCVILSIDEVITPLTPEFFSLDGIDIFASELKKINDGFMKEVKHNKIVINNMNKSFKRHVLLGEKLNKLNYNIFTIAQDSKIAESQLYNESIFEYCPDSKTIPEIKRLANSLMEI